ncbi:MAG: hypothetical protein OXH88_01870, partial [Gammaproteobacteria bacterium]|nr:hypothetical protein [Gammaproteobacteria bacterium]
IDLDVIIVCRKRSALSQFDQVEDWLKTAECQIDRLRTSGRRLSRNDVRVILMAQFLKHLSYKDSAKESLQLLDGSEDEIDRQIERLHGAGTLEVRGKAA